MDDLVVLSELIENPSIRRIIRTTVCQMADFVRWARHPDGGIPLLNDAALEVGLSYHELCNRLRQVGLDTDASWPRGGRHFQATGLAIWRGRPWTVFFDVGPIGPDIQPGHAHADNLSLECSYDDVRLFVDPGTYSYDYDDRRAYDRSTAAHNTLCVDRADSSEVWHIFRVGHRARPFDVEVRADENALDASAAHDGYAPIGRVIHRRRIQVADGAPLVIIDQVEGRSRHQVEGGWLLEPCWSATPNASGWTLRNGDRHVTVTVHAPADLELSLESRPWHPQFGLEVPTVRLAWRWYGELPLEVTTTVEPVRDDGPSMSALGREPIEQSRRSASE
jgi:hypothetical protein